MTTIIGKNAGRKYLGCVPSILLKYINGIEILIKNMENSKYLFFASKTINTIPVVINPIRVRLFIE